MSGLFVIVLLAALVGVFKPYIKGVGRWQFGLGAFLAFIMVGVVAKPSANTASKPQPVASGTEGSEPTDKAPDVVHGSESNWQYHTEKDEMRGTESRYAQLEGSNTINLNFPYGEQRGRLLVRQSAQHGFDVLVGVRSGQIMCNSFSNSHINVKFDDGPIQRYGCVDASDGTNNMVFVEGAEGFLRKLKKSQKMIVEAEFYRNGMQQIKFDTARLKWAG